MKRANLLFFILLFVSLFLFGAVLMINRSVVLVRVYELSQKLEKLNKLEKGVDYMDILFKYEMNRRAYIGKIDDGTFDVEELKVISILSRTDTETEKLEQTAVAVLPFINCIRYMLGKSPIKYGNTRSQEQFDLAYFYERNGYFRKALTIYTKNEDPHSQDYPAVLLHEGYCYALSGQDTNAEKTLSRVINEYRNQDIAVAAATLLMYIRDFREESDKIYAENSQTLENSIKLIQLTSFDGAFKMLSKLDNTDKDTAVKIMYYKARYYEETGDKKVAIDLYQNVIIADTDNDVAKKANRRLFIIASAHPGNKTLTKLTDTNNLFLRDDLYAKMKEISKSIATEAAPKSQGNDADAIDEKKITQYVEAAAVLAEKKSREIKRESTDGSYTLSYYSKSGIINKIESFDAAGKLKGYYLYVYDKRGNRIRIDEYDADGHLMEYY